MLSLNTNSYRSYKLDAQQVLHKKSGQDGLRISFKHNLFRQKIEFVSNTRRLEPLYAKKKEKPVLSDSEEELDPDMRKELNNVANEAVRVMLSEDIQEVLAYKDKVDSYGEILVANKEIDAARFMLVIRGMLDHKIVEEVKDLNGPYEKAFLKIGGIMEDSGWLLEQVGEEPGACMEMLDEELIPPVMRNPY